MIYCTNSFVMYCWGWFIIGFTTLRRLRVEKSLIVQHASCTISYSEVWDTQQSMCGHKWTLEFDLYQHLDHSCCSES